jgi:rare lipoprotein A
VVVRINDRGPYKKGRILDLSYGAAKKIDMIGSGVVRIQAKIVKLGER